MRALALCLALAGCVDAAGTGEDPAGGGKGDDPGTCADPKYGDGTCHMDLGCGIPDIDCYQVFATDDDAYATASGLGISVLPTSDAHYAKARALLDKSWDMFKANTPLGKLAEQRLSLVLISDPTVNAYVYPSTTMPGMAYDAVFIHTGLLDSAMTADEFHGIMFHELTHLQKLHTTDEIVETTHRYYVAPVGAEPIGAAQIDHAEVRELFVEWNKVAKFAGVFTYPALAGLPYGGDIHFLFNAYYAQLDSRGTQCAGPLAAVRTRTDALEYSQYDSSLIITPAHTAESTAAIAALKQCLLSDPLTFHELRGLLGSAWDPWLVPELTPADAALENMRAFDAILALQADRRAKLLALQKSAETKLGRPWSALRFFSIEEQADDHSAQLTKITQVHETGVTGFLMAAMSEPDRARCQTELATATPMPYGDYMIDDHHASCWRIAHARQVAADTTRRAELDTRAPAPWVPTRLSRPRPIY
jgi:hypothetical protein